MIIPSIDLMAGSTVQLVRGRDKALDAGSPRPIAERFGMVGEIAVIDLDAALGSGSNRELIEDLLPLARCRVGGGIREYETAVRWLDAGAAKIIIGTQANADWVARLPRERVIAAVDAYDGEIVTHGWRTRTGDTIESRIEALRDRVGGFLVTFVETEGTLGGFNIDRAVALGRLAGDARLTVAGGVATPEQIGMLDRAGIDAQVGMALYTGVFGLADAVGTCLSSDRADGLWPTVVCDEHGVALGLAYSSPESLRAALTERRGVYQSRRRGLWRKGETSGAVQQLLRVDMDCDRDALRFTVRQTGDFCHLNTRTCFGAAAGVSALSRRIASTIAAPSPGSYTARVLNEPGLLDAKLREEIGELIEARTPKDIAHEAADVMYFLLVRAAAAGVTLEQIDQELDRRSLRLTRRPGNAKTASPTSATSAGGSSS